MKTKQCPPEGKSSANKKASEGCMARLVRCSSLYWVWLTFTKRRLAFVSPDPSPTLNRGFGFGWRLETVNVIRPKPNNDGSFEDEMKCVMVNKSKLGILATKKSLKIILERSIMPDLASADADSNKRPAILQLFVDKAGISGHNGLGLGELGKVWRRGFIHGVNKVNSSTNKVCSPSGRLWA